MRSWSSRNIQKIHGSPCIWSQKHLRSSYLNCPLLGILPALHFPDLQTIRKGRRTQGADPNWTPGDLLQWTVAPRLWKWHFGHGSMDRFKGKTSGNSYVSWGKHGKKFSDFRQIFPPIQWLEDSTAGYIWWLCQFCTHWSEFPWVCNSRTVPWHSSRLGVGPTPVCGFWSDAWPVLLKSIIPTWNSSVSGDFRMLFSVCKGRFWQVY